jgi:hypothetical protein
MGGMANHAYMSLWLENFSEATMLENCQRFLETVPCSPQEPGFTELVIRAVGPAEIPILEKDLRAVTANAADVMELLAEHIHSDSSYEVAAWWDLWVYVAETGQFELRPQPLAILINGPDYDEGIVAREDGHIRVDAGFEHLFTGHGGMLGAGTSLVAPEHPAEAAFLSAMMRPGKLDEYHEKTNANIRALLDWAARARAALRVKQLQLWSEGEENFEARMDEILASI